MKAKVLVHKRFIEQEMLRYSNKEAGTPNGERIVKRSSLGETVYVSASYTERDGKTVSRHIFAAGTRIASKVYTKQDNTLTLQNELYYHTDHLGSSSTVSDKNGNFYEKTEYLPYGETWINERQTGDGVAYLFTGKEKDEETGFYNHGARNRDARIGMWLSVDQSLEEYLPKPPNSDEAKEHNKKLPGMGGAFNTVNLNLYHYAGNNPVVMSDPDGRWFLIDDIIYSFASKLANLQNKGEFWKGVANSLVESWAHPIKHIQSILRFKTALSKNADIEVEKGGITYNDKDNKTSFNVGATPSVTFSRDGIEINGVKEAHASATYTSGDTSTSTNSGDTSKSRDGYTKIGNSFWMSNEIHEKTNGFPSSSGIKPGTNLNRIEAELAKEHKENNK
jgi:RHS repeat-associated protein